MKAEKTNFWKSQSTKHRGASKAETAKEGLAAARKSHGSRVSVTRTEECVPFSLAVTSLERPV